jgi:hypothetical protein
MTVGIKSVHYVDTAELTYLVSCLKCRKINEFNELTPFHTYHLFLQYVRYCQCSNLVQSHKYSLPTQEIDIGAKAKICSKVLDICSGFIKLFTFSNFASISAIVISEGK